MLELSSWFIIGVVYNIVFCCIYSRLNKKNEIKFNFFFIFLAAVTYCLSLPYKLKTISLLFKFTFTTIMLKKTYNDKLSKTIITTFLIYIIFSIGEMLFAITFVGLLGVNQEYIQTNLFGIIETNLIILFISIIIIRIKFIKEKLLNIIKWYTNKKVINNIILIILGILMIFLFILNNYRKINSIENFILLNIFFIGVVVFIIEFFVEKTNNAKLITKYDQLLDYVNAYGKLIDEKTKNQHEFRNQLILIKEMLGNRNKKVIKYIDEQLEIEESNIDYDWINKLKNIPDEGLSGLIYYKVREMVKENIKIYIEINKNVNKNKIKKYIEQNLNDISKIVCIYLDNAREASVLSDKKYIILEIDGNNSKFNFHVSNTYKGSIDVNRIGLKGYSSKGRGRGMGLAIVNDILDTHSEIFQKREFNGIYYVQHVSFIYK